MVLYTGISSNVAKNLASNGFTFVGYDQRGHGRSEGEKGYLDDYKLVLKDAVTFV
jgi:alpha-beta hydrolase superfamily lysophospholipase